MFFCYGLFFTMLITAAGFAVFINIWEPSTALQVAVYVQTGIDLVYQDRRDCFR